MSKLTSRMWISTALMLLAAPDDLGSVGGGVDRNAAIRSALSRLDPSKDADWTAAGLPAMDRVKELSGLDDLGRQEVGEAVPGFNRSNAGAAPSDLGNAGGGGDAGPEPVDKSEDKGEPGAPRTPVADADTAAEEMKERANPNLRAEDNPNVGRTDLSAAETQRHTSDQDALIEAQAQAETADGTPSDIAEAYPDPILLIEAAMIAMNSDERFRRNGELQNFMRGYILSQNSIRAHQGRLNERHERAEKEEAERAAKPKD